MYRKYFHDLQKMVFEANIVFVIDELHEDQESNVRLLNAIQKLQT